jgi:anti-sigma-K factor RskA
MNRAAPQRRSSFNRGRLQVPAGEELVAECADGVLMPPGEPDPERAHPEAAGWVLGTLDPDEADRFAVHLRSCADCQAAVADLRPAARLLQTAAPAAEPPEDLQARTLDAVAQAATSARPGKRHIWRRTRSRQILALAAAVVIAAAVSAGLLVSRPAPAQAYTVVLRPQPGAGGGARAAAGRAVATQAAGGWSIQLTVSRLADLGPGRFYECWWAGPGNRPGHPVLISAGTFTVGRSGAVTAQMWTAANPGTFQGMQITAQTSAGSGQHGRIVLTGTATN